MTDGHADAPIPAAPAVIRSEALFGARRELIIRHGDAEYRLRITKTDKLILTK
ncbi:MAG TPA: hemin uptake protein HemP [Methylomirabilota bacterium]|jgi:hemin uptake protein HemP|nr:hemin uptake protein HemP [Methylomirabilota bacterium]